MGVFLNMFYESIHAVLLEPDARPNKMMSYQDRNSKYMNKTVLRLSYYHNGLACRLFVISVLTVHYLCHQHSLCNREAFFLMGFWDI